MPPENKKTPFKRLLLLLTLATACADAGSNAITDPIRLRIAASPMPAEVATFYAARDHAPVWDASRLRQLAAALRELEYDGLDPRDYGLPELAPGVAPPASLEAAVQRELRLSGHFLRALLHLRHGKVDPHRLDPRWNIEPRPDDAPAVLTAARAAVQADDIEQAFTQMRARHPAYASLREALRALRRIEAAGGWPAIAEGPLLQPGVTDARVPLLRARLAAGGYLPATASGDERFDEALAQALRRFQAEQYLAETGTVDPATRAALNVPVSARIAQLRVNLERARWILPEIHDDFVLVDVAGYRLHVFRGARSVWQSRVQVGRAVRRTPIFKSAITHVTLNPAWTVPPGILRRDVLPKLRKGTGYLRQNRLRAIDARGREVDPGDVDWKDPKGITLRQDAWPGGALGRVAIRFPSPYMVYLHKTPHTRLFSEQQRAFSSGCIRVEKAYELAAMLLGWEESELDRHVAGGRTHNVNLPQPMTILLLYWTVDLHEGRRVAYKPDLYRLDPPTLAALDRRAAAIAPAPRRGN
jgi:L,D-transpeptidase YcbB